MRTTASEENPDRVTAEPVEAYATGRSLPWGWSMPSEPRRGRIALALLGAVVLCAAVVTAILGMLGIVSPLVPLLCLVVVGAAVGGLRMLAIRDRHARVERAFAEAMAPMTLPAPRPAVEEPPAPAVPRRPTVLFDAENAAPRQASPMALRTAALAGTHGSSAVDVNRAEDAPPAVRPAQVGAAPDVAPVPPASWVPVEVPRPTYVEAAKAERPAPAPLELPEVPRASTRTPIKTAEAAARRAGSEDERAAISDVPRPRIDLDNVLQRRRA